MVDIPVAAIGRRQLVTIVGGIVLGVALGALDTAAVTTALPAISRELRGLEHLSWIVAAYLLTSTALTLVYGKLGDIVGRRPLMLFAIVLFVVASLICALAQNVVELVAARALQGAAAGGIQVTGSGMLAQLASPRERARLQIYVASTIALASAAGPPLGGFFVDHLSWRWVFWINLPIGVFAYLLCRAFPATNHTVRRRIDYLGLLMLTGTITTFLLVASWGGNVYPWLSPPILGAIALGLGLLGFFIRRERATDDPILPPRLFAITTIRLGTILAFLSNVLMFGAIVLIPVFLQFVTHVSAGSSGALMVPLLLGMALTAICTSQFLRRTGRYRGMVPAGMALAALAYGLFSTFTATSPMPLLIVALIFMGMCIGLTVPILNVVVQNSADPRDLGVAIASLNFSRSLGGAFGASIFWSLFIAFSGAGIGGNPEAVAAMGSEGGLANVFGAVDTFHHVFLVGIGIAVVAFLLALALPEEPLKTTRPGERPQ